MNELNEEQQMAVQLSIKYVSDANFLVIPAGDTDEDLDRCLKIHLMLNAAIASLQVIHGGYKMTLDELQYHLDLARDKLPEYH